MKKDPIALLYVCTRDVDFFFEYLLKNHPALYLVSLQVHSSKNAVAAIPKYGSITVLTSNVFYEKNGKTGADGHPEKDMTGSKLAQIIKKKNPKARVYLYSQWPAQGEIFDGIFKRDAINDLVPEELQKLLNSVFAMPAHPYGRIKNLRDSLRTDKQHMRSAPMSIRNKKLLAQKIFEDSLELALITKVLKLLK